MIRVERAPDDARAFLASTELFAEVEDQAVRDVADRLEWVLVRGGEDVCRQGEAGSSLFLVATGKLRVIIAGADGRERVVRELGRGENVGEMSLLTGAPRSATVTAIRDSVLARLTREGFNALVAAHPEAMLPLTRMLARWLDRANQREQRPDVPTTVTVRAGSSDVPLRWVAETLATALGEIGPTLHLHADRVDGALFAGAADEDETGEGYGRVTRWLSEQEASHRFVLYESDVGRPAWARRCVRQADRLLTVVRSEGQPREIDRGTADRGSTAQSHLVLLHRAGTGLPQATRRWRPDRYDAHHHLREDRPAHFGRLARHLAGQAVGLVLGGGGARGFAHLGVVRALMESGVPIDRIGGTSMGAMMGALIAMERSYADLVSLNEGIWPRLAPNRDFTIPLISIMSGRRGIRICDELYGDVDIEDLWIPFFCCSANLTRSELVVHRYGRLAFGARATASIPGAAPPVVTDDGELLVDGGVLSNLPADLMLEQGGGPVIAVDVSQQQDLSLEAWDGELPSPWRALARHLWPFSRSRPYPNILHILMRTTTLSSLRVEQQVREQVDLYLQPPVVAFDLFGWNQIEAIAEVGYRYALERLQGSSLLTAAAPSPIEGPVAAGS